MRKSFQLALAVGCLGLVVGQANAQGFRGGFGGPGMLMANEGVQKELKVTDEQKGKLKELGDKLRTKIQEEFGKLRDLKEEERREKGRELGRQLNEETYKALGEILQPEQLKRLKQIDWQQQGARAFGNPEIQKNLKITDEQKEKLKTIGEESGKKFGEIFQNAQGNREEAGKKMAELRKETLEKTMGVLSDDQKKAWKEMTGEPFEVKFEPRRRPNN